jgi:hypothetical protein
MGTKNRLMDATLIYLNTLEGQFSIYKLSPDQEVPEQLLQSGFWSITKTPKEISIVSGYRLESGDVKSNHGWRAFKVEGTLDFSLIGIINQITGLLKENNISVFVISTYNTDYFLVKENSFLKTVKILNEGNNIRIR